MLLSQISRNDDGSLPSYAWPGGYQMYYLDKENSILCPDCANKSDRDPDEVPQFKPVEGEVYYEGPTMHCDQCNAEIESAYGDPEEEEK